LKLYTYKKKIFLLKFAFQFLQSWRMCTRYGQQGGQLMDLSL